MPKTPSENHRESLGEKSLFSSKFRLVVAFVLGAAMGGIGKDLLISHRDGSGSQAARVKLGDGGSEEPLSQGKSKSKNWVVADEFDKSPYSYVDPTQCRELVLKWDGAVIGDQEVVDRAKVVVERQRNRAAGALITELCISNPEDQRAIVEWMKDHPNCTQPPKFEYLRNVGGRNELGLSCEAGGIYRSSVDLEKKPGCRPEKTETEKLREEIDAEDLEAVRMLSLKGASAFMGFVEPNQLMEKARKAGAEKELEEFVGWTKRMKEMDIGKMKKGDLMRFACAWKIFSEEKFSETVRSEKIKNNPELDESIGVSLNGMRSLADAILLSEGVEDGNLEECIEYLGNIGPQ